MESIVVTNVNHALARGIQLLLSIGIKETSRNGDVLVAPCPVTTTYMRPVQRVLFSPMRDANPFFHLMEALWMLAGRNDLAFPLVFNSRFGAYSDDGVSVHGAYGYRWKWRFGYDQLDMLVQELRQNPNSRRAVLTMWDGWAGEGSENNSDLHVAMAGGKDVPCNTHAYLDVRGGRLNMTVCCRSNDILWGAYGANAVHFSILLEYLAARIGVAVGVYRQMSNNYHLYMGILKVDEKILAIDCTQSDHYGYGKCGTMPIMNTEAGQWHEQLAAFMANPMDGCFKDPFFEVVAKPMVKAWTAHKTKSGDALEYAQTIAADDWRLACTQWLQRRQTNRAAAAEGRPQA